jgi:hypothetical protein
MKAQSCHLAASRVAFVSACLVYCGANAQEQTAPAPSNGATAQQQPAPAPSPRFGIELGYGQSDNVERSVSQVRSDVEILGLDFATGRESRRVSGALVGDIDWRVYTEQSAVSTDDEVVGSVDGTLALDIVPRRFGWIFAQNFGQTRTNPLLATGPDNRERVAVWSTGPRINVPLGERNTVAVEAIRSERRFGDSELIDSTVSAVRAEAFHALTTASRIGIDVSKQETDFDSDQMQGYDFQTFAVAYERTFASGGVNIRLGRGKVTIGDDSTPTSLANFEWNRDVGARSRLRAWANRELTDAGQLFSAGSVPGLGAADSLGGSIGGFGINDARLRDVIVTASPVERTGVGTAIDVVGTRTNASLSLGLSEDRFETDQSLDNDGSFWQLALSRRLNPRWNVQLNFQDQRRDFVALDDDSEDFFSTMSVARQLGTRASVALSLRRNSRESDFDSFDEDEYIVSWRYDFSR